MNSLLSADKHTCFLCFYYFLSAHRAGRLNANDSFIGSPVRCCCSELIDKWIASCLRCSSCVKHKLRASTQAAVDIVHSYQTPIRLDASQLLTRVAPHPVRELMPGDLLKDGMLYCHMSGVFVHLSITSLLWGHSYLFMSLSLLFLLWTAISHMVANRHNNAAIKTEAQEGSAYIWKGVPLWPRTRRGERGGLWLGVALGVTWRAGGGHWQCRGVETDEDLEESSTAEREHVGGLQSCSSSCLWKQMEEIRATERKGVRGQRSAVEGVQALQLIGLTNVFASICSDQKLRIEGKVGQSTNFRQPPP